MRRLVRILLPLALLVPATGAAHARLVSSTPADGAVLETAPARIDLRFDGRVERRFARLELEEAGGRAHALVPDGPGDGAARELKVALPSLERGRHRLRYSVVSADGHRIEGTIRFELR